MVVQYNTLLFISLVHLPNKVRTITIMYVVTLPLSVAVSVPRTSIPRWDHAPVLPFGAAVCVSRRVIVVFGFDAGGFVPNIID